MRLSNLYLEEERYQDVLALEQEDIDSVLTKWNLAKAYQALEREEALEHFQAIAEDLKDNPEFLQDYAYILREFGYHDRARQIAQHYLQLVPDDMNMADFLTDENWTISWASKGAFLLCKNNIMTKKVTILQNNVENAFS